MIMIKKICEGCGCDPCDCSWGNYINNTGGMACQKKNVNAVNANAANLRARNGFDGVIFDVVVRVGVNQP